VRCGATWAAEGSEYKTARTDTKSRNLFISLTVEVSVNLTIFGDFPVPRCYITPESDALLWDATRKLWDYLP
jgi:hypothetical protein